MLGTASSAYQVEGAWNDEGKRNIIYLYNIIAYNNNMYFIQLWTNYSRLFVGSLLMIKKSKGL